MIFSGEMSEQKFPGDEKRRLEVFRKTHLRIEIGVLHITATRRGFNES
jgi:hypothetical protein